MSSSLAEGRNAARHSWFVGGESRSNQQATAENFSTSKSWLEMLLAVQHFCLQF
jgi:hypothetical protein